MTRPVPAGPRAASTGGRADDRPVLTITVAVVTVMAGVAALTVPSLLHLATRDLTRLRSGQWWRVLTPVFVQPSGWGQLAFNVLGVVVVGAALEHRFGGASWVMVYLAGGSGTIAVYGAWHPADTGGGSSAAVAALIGAFLVVINVGGQSGWLDWFALLYTVFFAVYLTGLDLGGLGVSIIAGNLAIIGMFISRRFLRPRVVDRASLVVVLVASVVMTVARDDHGVGLAIGFTLTAMVLARRWLLSNRAARRSRHTALAVVGVVAAAGVTWLGWVHLLGIPLLTIASGGSRSEVGWIAVVVLAGACCLAASVALQALRRRWPARGVRIWVALCVGVAVLSTAGPLAMGAGATPTAALISLHLVCAATIIATVPRREHHPQIVSLSGRPAPAAPAARNRVT